MTKPNQPWFTRRELPADVRTIHLIGIAGSGMGAFACMLQDAGYEVRGSDRGVYPPMSDTLRAKGISWMEGFEAAHLDWDPDLVVVGNVCRRDNPEAVEAERRGIALSFPQVFGDLFLEGALPVVVTGTHGKTTTTSITAWLLEACGRDPGLLVGGLAKNFGATYKLGGAGRPFVVEGDEYDTAYFDKGPKFLHYRPRVAILNNIEFDHADIYDDLDEIIENFDRLVDILGPETTLVANADDPLVVARAARTRGAVTTYGFAEGADLRASELRPSGGGCTFTLTHAGEAAQVETPMAGRHNVWNALAAIGAGLALGVPLGDLVAALPAFAGVGKRQEERGEVDGVLVIDDYAHHPTAIRETLAALRARYPARTLWAVYEPKSNTARRNIHQQAYGEAFVDADQVVLAKPFVKQDGLAADRKLDVDRLVAEIAARGTPATYHPGVEGCLAHLLAHARAGDVVAIMANSGFGGIHDKLLAGLAAR